jgi:REP element-mobilizing transposase RayT
MEHKVKLEFGKTYHIFNRGIDKCDIFLENSDYEHFMRLYDRHIREIAVTFAWILMRNHFHLLARIKSEDEIMEHRIPVNSSQNLELKSPHQYFSNLCNAYAKSFNKKYKRTGSLFQNRFQRKPIDDIEYFKKAIVYIHLNPVKHGFVDEPEMYNWSSYNSIISYNSDQKNGNRVIGSFDGLGNFVSSHNSEFDFKDFEKWLNL